jgi:DNA-directed RNA polymerase specialized sigma24 family protein
MRDEPQDDDIRYYEGLVAHTATMYLDVLRVEREDLEQVLRFTIWRALESYTATRWNTRGHDAKGRSARERFAFYCMRNQIKDLLKARGRRDSAKPDWMGDSITGVREVYLEDAASDRAGDAHGSFRDRFEGKYLAQRPGDRHEDEVMLPATLTGDERQVVVLLYLDFSQAEIARLLSVRPRDIGVRVASVREKMADWRPVPATSMSQPTVKVQLASEAWALIEAVAA